MSLNSLGENKPLSLQPSEYLCDTSVSLCVKKHKTDRPRYGIFSMTA